jgi:hypothetical protein
LEPAIPVSIIRGSVRRFGAVPWKQVAVHEDDVAGFAG